MICVMNVETNVMKKICLEFLTANRTNAAINKIEYSYDGINEIKQYLDYICERGA